MIVGWRAHGSRLNVQQRNSRKLRQTLGELPAQGIPADGQPFEVLKPPERVRNGPGELVVVEIESAEVRQVAQPDRDGAAQVVPGKSQRFEVVQVAQSGRDRAGQLVIPEPQ